MRKNLIIEKIILNVGRLAPEKGQLKLIEEFCKIEQTGWKLMILGDGPLYADLQARIKEDELRMKKLTFAHAISPLENPQSIRTLRRDISRSKTALRKKQLWF